MQKCIEAITKYAKANGLIADSDGYFSIRRPDNDKVEVFFIDHKKDIWFPVVIDFPGEKPLGSNEVWVMFLIRVDLYHKKMLLVDLVRECASPEIKGSLNDRQECYLVYKITVKKELLSDVESVQDFFIETEPKVKRLLALVDKYENEERG